MFLASPQYRTVFKQQIKANLLLFSVMPALKRTRLTASAWRETNWCINCVLMRVMERRLLSLSRRSITLINTQLIHQFVSYCSVCLNIALLWLKLNHFMVKWKSLSSSTKLTALDLKARKFCKIL